MPFSIFNKTSTSILSRSIKLVEWALAVFVVAGVIIYLFHNVGFFFSADWTAKETLYELIYRVLLVTIGLELSRMLITHSFLAILELLAFVVARKMLKPDIETFEVFLGVLAFVLILVSYRYCIVPFQKHKGAE